MLYILLLNTFCFKSELTVCIYSMLPAPCPTGMMYSPTADDCIACHPGTYQDDEGQFQCKQCPVGTKTITERARTKDQCTGELVQCPVISTRY